MKNIPKIAELIENMSVEEKQSLEYIFLRGDSSDFDKPFKSVNNFLTALYCLMEIHHEAVVEEQMNIVDDYFDDYNEPII
tara:strand:+ start:15 stop:254 length:240 start_codon:yes stop_codon:yes gene_type:complete